MLKRLQFLGSSITNNLKDDQIYTVRNDLNGSTHLSYNSANFSSFQVTAAHGAHRQVFINDTTNLSKSLPVINDTIDLSKKSLVINDTTNLSKRLPVINDTTDLSKGLPYQ